MAGQCGVERRGGLIGDIPCGVKTAGNAVRHALQNGKHVRTVVGDTYVNGVAVAALTSP
jgi:hypothetical protein